MMKKYTDLAIQYKREMDRHIEKNSEIAEIAHYEPKIKVSKTRQIFLAVFAVCITILILTIYFFGRL